MKRERLRPMHWRMSERLSQVMRFDRVPIQPFGEKWLDQGVVRATNWWGVCHFYTPWGIANLFRAFQRRIQEVEAGDSKRAIKREIQSNPHLHSKLKRRLLQTLVRAPIRQVGRGNALYWDSYFSALILSGGRPDHIIRGIENNPILSEETKENLLYNLDQIMRDA